MKEPESRRCKNENIVDSKCKVVSAMQDSKKKEAETIRKTFIHFITGEFYD